MALEWVFVMMAGIGFGMAVWGIAGLISGVSFSRDLVPDNERQASLSLMLPLIAGLTLLSFLTGWAIQEPNPADERVCSEWLPIVGLVGVVLFRSIWRALYAFRESKTYTAAIFTVGFFSPRVEISEAFRQKASERVLAAAVFHERAHVRHRDPLRIWLMQIIVDLQWPIPGIGQRFRRWLIALELERDTEALMQGACPLALAEAILIAAQLQLGKAQTRAVVGVAGDGRGVELRIRRLLAARTTIYQVRNTSTGDFLLRWLFLCVMALCGAVYLGVLYGENVLAALPGVIR